jgi:hypothetical protein
MVWLASCFWNGLWLPQPSCHDSAAHKVISVLEV